MWMYGLKYDPDIKTSSNTRPLPKKPTLAFKSMVEAGRPLWRPCIGHRCRRRPSRWPFSEQWHSLIVGQWGKRNCCYRTFLHRLDIQTLNEQFSHYYYYCYIMYTVIWFTLCIRAGGRAGLQPSFSSLWASPFWQRPTWAGPAQPYTIYYIIVCVFFTVHFR